ncbi:hypothetical protein D3C76_1269630 [compost metagenome]
MRAADQFGLAVAADGGKLWVAVGNQAGGVGGGNKPLTRGETLLDRGYREIEAHDETPFTDEPALCPSTAIGTDPHRSAQMCTCASSHTGMRPNDTGDSMMTVRSSGEFYEIHHINPTKVINHGVAPCG